MNLSTDRLVAEYADVVLSRDELRAAVHPGELAKEMVEPTDYLLATLGKQLRAQLLFCAAAAGPRSCDASIRDMAIAVELLHLGTLAHDDVVDDGTLRRGVPTIGVEHGSLVSGFVGSMLMAQAIELVASAGAEPTRRLSGTLSAMCLGQMEEFENIFNIERPIAHYQVVVEGKTASLFEFAAWLGSWLAGFPPETVAAVSRFAKSFGMAFQIRDDIFDLVAPPHLTKKKCSDDLRHGVFTLPTLYAIAADPQLKRTLVRELDDESLVATLKRIKHSGAIGRAVMSCESFVKDAVEALQINSIESATRNRLCSLIQDTIEPLHDCLSAVDLD